MEETCNNLTNLMLKVPSKIRTDKNDFKYLLRGSVENIIPKKNLANRKRGFVGLESQKISHNFDILINETFEKNKIMRQGIFQEKFLKKFLIPDKISPGNIKVYMYELKNNEIVKILSKNLQIKKGGISFKLEKMLKTESFIYIIILIAISLLLSLVTNLIFRKK